MTKIKLAIVVPTRDSSRFIPKLVRSFQEQALLDFRVIFVDDSTSVDEVKFLDDFTRLDDRLSWIPQNGVGTAIYGAMNIGFRLLRPYEWVLFWGSDDWASSPNSLYEAVSHPSLLDADLVVCSGRYIQPDSKGGARYVRSTSFRWLFNYRLSMFLGSTPPHQCTLIGPGARRLRDYYDDSLRIAADLDYFLSLSLRGGCNVRIISVPLVDIAVGGISGIQHRRRVMEVFHAYYNAFGVFCVIPFFLRYLQRLLTFCGLP